MVYHIEEKMVVFPYPLGKAGKDVLHVGTRGGILYVWLSVIVQVQRRGFVASGRCMHVGCRVCPVGHHDRDVVFRHTIFIDQCLIDKRAVVPITLVVRILIMSATDELLHKYVLQHF